MKPEDHAHRYAQGAHENAYEIGIVVGGSPGKWPNISNDDAEMKMMSQPRFQEDKENTHEPMTFPSCEIQLISASATARFAGGYDTEPLAQARKTMKPP